MATPGSRARGQVARQLQPRDEACKGRGGEGRQGSAGSRGTCPSAPGLPPPRVGMARAQCSTRPRPHPGPRACFRGGWGEGRTPPSPHPPGKQPQTPSPPTAPYPPTQDPQSLPIGPRYPPATKPPFAPCRPRPPQHPPCPARADNARPRRAGQGRAQQGGAARTHRRGQEPAGAERSRAGAAAAPRPAPPSAPPPTGHAPHSRPQQRSMNVRSLHVGPGSCGRSRSRPANGSAAAPRGPRPARSPLAGLGRRPGNVSISGSRAEERRAAGKGVNPGGAGAGHRCVLVIVCVHVRV